MRLTTGVWRSDPEHSLVRFAVPYLGISQVAGVFRQHRAEMVVGADGQPERFDFEIAAASVDTNDENRDLMITSMDFLDVEANPTITYRSDQVEVDGAGMTVTGQLKINGIGHVVTVGARLSEEVAADSGVMCVGLTATGHVSRFAFGLREPSDPRTRAQPDADLIRFQTDVTLCLRPD
ncbi:MAG: YceI family protein [Actinomycetota bacterium]